MSLGDNFGLDKMLVMKFKQLFLLKMSFKLPFKILISLKRNNKILLWLNSDGIKEC